MESRDMHVGWEMIARALAVAITLGLVATACGSDASTADGDNATTTVALDETSGDRDDSVVDEASDAGASTTTSSAGASTSDSPETTEAPSEATPVVPLTESSYLGNYQLADESFGTMVTVTVEDGTRTIVTNALPDHETGAFPNQGNPNVISAQNLTWTFPTEARYVGEPTATRTSGVAVNGIKFEPGTAETVTCTTGETYRVEAIQAIFDLGLDFNNAHVQPTGEYHYHGISQLLVDAYDDDSDLALIGFAADGHLMYYSKSGAYTSGYALSTTARTGTGCDMSTPNAPDPGVLDGTTPDGTYTSDWVFSTANGTLDECNGTVIDGQYAYIVTDSFPYISRCVMGDVTGVAGIGGGQGGTPGQGRPPRRDG